MTISFWALGLVSVKMAAKFEINFLYRRFVQPLEQHTFGQKVLKVCFQYHNYIWEYLMKPSPNQTLINIGESYESRAVPATQIF